MQESPREHHYDLYNSLVEETRKKGLVAVKNTRILSTIAESVLNSAYSRYKVGELVFIRSPHTNTWEIWANQETMTKLDTATRSPSEQVKERLRITLGKTTIPRSPSSKGSKSGIIIG